MPDAPANLFPRRAACGIGVRFSQSTLEVLALLISECQNPVLLSNAVPEILDQLEPLSGRELKNLLSKGVCHSCKFATGTLMQQAMMEVETTCPARQAGG